MKKLIYAAFTAAVVVVAQGCAGSGSKGNDVDSDSIKMADSIAAVQADSLAKVAADSIAKADSVAKADSIAKAGASAKIDKKLKEFSNYVADIRDGFYVDGQFYPGGGMAVRTFFGPAQKINGELASMEKDMTDAQKAKYHKMRNSIKEAL